MKEPKDLEEAFYTVVEEMAIIFKKKQNDYGPDNIAATGVKGVWLRMWDKINRLKRLVWEGRERMVEDEPLTQTWLDIANYCVIAVMVERGWWGKDWKN